MRHVRTLGVSLLAVLALGAVVAGAAQAKQTLPEMGQCLPSEGGNTGKYANSNCTVEVKKLGGVSEGPYEWTPEADNGEEMETSGGFTFETESGVKIECAAFGSSSFMRFLEHNGKTPLWRLNTCKSAANEKCSTPSVGSAKDVIGNSLEWKEEEGRGWNPTLGFIEGKKTTSPVVGLSFKGTKQTGEVEGEVGYERLFPPIVCATYNEEGEPVGGLGSVWIGGDNEKDYKGQNGVIGVLSPVDQMTKTYTLTYGSHNGEQAVASFEKKKPQYLEAYFNNHWERVAFNAQITFQMEGEAGIEIKARK